ncbi:MAG: helix-turn-helix domain-containing protein [Anaerolineales bacterium]|nr:helix-turn-helix domain-containing protein [Anaerolineales bacterium]
MSVETTNRVWKHSQKGGAALLLLLAMADWADDWGYCYPSVDKMAIKCRQTERNILNLTRNLEAAGELRRIARGKGGRGKYSGSVYQVITGMTADQIAASERLSPTGIGALEKLQSGEMLPLVPRKSKEKTDEKISGENFSGEKTSPDFSPVYPCALNELKYVRDSKTPPAPAKPLGAPVQDDLPETLYRLVRPTHLTIPNSDQRPVALKVLTLYLQRHGSAEAAAEALRPYALEADQRGISPTNLCWLSEWAAVGQIPPVRKKGRSRTPAGEKQSEKGADTIDYESLKKRMEAELTPLMNPGQERAA